MKALYIPAGLMALILAFSLWTGHYVRQRTDHWTAMLEHADEAAMAEDWSSAEKRLLDAYADWDSSQCFFHTIMSIWTCWRKPRVSASKISSSGALPVQYSDERFCRCG